MDQKEERKNNRETILEREWERKVKKDRRKEWESKTESGSMKSPVLWKLKFQYGCPEILKNFNSKISVKILQNPSFGSWILNNTISSFNFKVWIFFFKYQNKIIQKHYI